MTQREYKLTGIRESWKLNFVVNYMAQRLLKNDESFSDNELFYPRTQLAVLSNGTILQSQGGILRLMNSDEKIEESKVQLTKLLNGIKLREI